MKNSWLILSLVLPLTLLAQPVQHNFKIRTITAGISLRDLSDTSSVIEAVDFLKKARNEFVGNGYEVQTIRIATQHFHEYVKNISYRDALVHLKKLDRIAKRENVMLSIGEILPANQYSGDVAAWTVALIQNTTNIYFSIPISSPQYGIHDKSIKAAAEITIALANNSEGAEGNFRFAATANCQAGIPFFPAAFHQGKKSFAIGLETPNLLREVFLKSDWTNAKENLKKTLENKFQPVVFLATQLASTSNWQYDGIDSSPASGLDASIGDAIETLTKQPFGEPSTLRACALITDVIKNLKVKTCGYSGLMLPVIEDKTLAKRATEKRFTLQKLLLYSSVSGTGLDVVPLPGNTSVESLEAIFSDVAALSLKYSNKALSARLFLIPGKNAGDRIEFKNPFLTSSAVMEVN